jgi:hypothetical protein
MAQVYEWGPHIWKILHYHAEYAGQSILLADELRAWITLLKNTEGVLACAVCRDHYKRWKQEHPVEEILLLDRTTVKESLRTWLWTLHERVNEEKAVPMERRMSLGALATYKDIPREEITQSIVTLKGIFTKAVLHRQLNPVYVKEWLRNLSFLQKLLF